MLWTVSLSGIAYGLHRLEPYAAGANGDGTWHLEWVDVPSTVDDWVLEEIENDRSECDLSLLRDVPVSDPDLCQRLHRELTESPWIESVERVAKRADGTISVYAKYRHYLTFVFADGMGHLVDDVGTRLPREERQSLLEQSHGEPRMIYLEGARARPPACGQQWAGEDVQAGLKLVAYLHEHCPRALLNLFVAVDVSNYGDRLNRRDGHLKIRTVYPNRWIFWGLPPGEEGDVEATAARKLEMLWDEYCKHAQLPDIDRIDLRDEEGILVPRTPQG